MHFKGRFQASNATSFVMVDQYVWKSNVSSGANRFAGDFHPKDLRVLVAGSGDGTWFLLGADIQVCTLG